MRVCAGTISLTRSFPPATNRVYQLSVQGRDGGGLLSPQAAQVNISVYSGDLHPPVFTLTMYNFTVLENVPIGSRVGRVEATMSSGSTGKQQACPWRYLCHLTCPLYDR